VEVVFSDNFMDSLSAADVAKPKKAKIVRKKLSEQKDDSVKVFNLLKDIFIFFYFSLMFVILLLQLMRMKTIPRVFLQRSVCDFLMKLVEIWLMSGSLRLKRVKEVSF